MPVNATTGYDMSTIAQADGIIGTLQAINLYCDGYFGLIILMIVFFIMMISFSYFAGTKHALIGSSFILFLLALIFLPISLISMTTFYIIFAISVIMIIVAMKSGVY